MASLPPLNALRAFEASARHLNFRVAAEDLGVTQGAVAQQVRALEARLGAKLFERLPRGLRLTEAGRRFHAPLRRAFRLIEEAVDELYNQRQLTVSVTPSFASKWLVPRLNEFVTLYPEISVQIDAREGLADFTTDGVDIAVRQTRSRIDEDLISVPLISPKFVVVGSPELAAQVSEPADLLAHVLLSDAHGLWPLFLDQTGVKCRPRMMSFNQSGLAIDAAVSGQGFALADAQLISAELSKGHLVQACAEVLSDDLRFIIVSPKSPRQPDLVAKMRDWLLSQV